MTIKYVLSDNRVGIINFNPKTAVDVLPPQVYTLEFSDVAGFFLKILQPRLDSPSKIYGDMDQRIVKCLNTYISREASTGILLTGHKGTGKTLLMTTLANTVLDQLKLPVILIRHAFEGSDFETFVKHIGECCLLFDEFGKIYPVSYRSTEKNSGSQKSLLSLLDGIDKTKRLFIMTENSQSDISDFLLNRPGRIFYHFQYSKLDEVSVVDYCDDLAVPKNIVEDILTLLRTSKIFSFDILQALVEECLRYNTSIKDAIEELNIDLRPKLMALQILAVKSQTDPNLVLKIKTTHVDKPIDNDRWAKDVAGIILEHPMDSEFWDDPNIPETEKDYVHIRESQVVFQKDDKIIYDTGDYIVTAIESERMMQTYAF